MQWTAEIERGAVLVGAHLDGVAVEPARGVAVRNGATHITVGTWSD